MRIRDSDFAVAVMVVLGIVFFGQANATAQVSFLPSNSQFTVFAGQTITFDLSIDSSVPIGGASLQFTTDSIGSDWFSVTQRLNLSLFEYVVPPRMPLLLSTAPTPDLGALTISLSGLSPSEYLFASEDFQIDSLTPIGHYTIYSSPTSGVSDTTGENFYFAPPFAIQISVIPEPSSFLLLATGLIFFASRCAVRGPLQE